MDRPPVFVCVVLASERSDGSASLEAVAACEKAKEWQRALEILASLRSKLQAKASTSDFEGRARFGPVERVAF